MNGRTQYIISYEYLSGADFKWHRQLELTENPVEKIKTLLDMDFGAAFTSPGPQIKDITWERLSSTEGVHIVGEMK